MTRLAPPGWAVLSLGTLAAVAAWRMAWIEMWAVTIGSLAALVLAAVSCRLVAPVRALRSGVPDRVSVGDELPVTLAVRNLSRRSVRHQPALDLLGTTPIEVDLPAVGGGKEVTARYAIPTRRRGHLALGPVVVDQGDPLGLFRSVAEVTAASTVIVHPRHHPLILDPSGARRDLDSLRADRAAGTLTFHGLREYVPGDDLRRVHWRSSARTGTLVVRQDIDPSEPRTLLAIDLAEGSWTDDVHLDEGVEVAASVVRAATRAGHPLRYVDHGGVARETGEDGTDVLDDLAALALDAPVGAAERMRSQGAEGHGVVVLVTGAGARADHLVDQGRLVAPLVVVAVVQPEAEPSRRPVGTGMVLTAPDAQTLCEAWSRWRP
ncbi:MAG: DUF58 domain-containing protein [Iamia sp.]